MPEAKSQKPEKSRPGQRPAIIARYLGFTINYREFAGSSIDNPVKAISINPSLVASKNLSLRGAKRRSNPEKSEFSVNLDCFAPLAMTDQGFLEVPHCEEQSDEAIQEIPVYAYTGLLRSARNDGLRSL